MNDLPEFDEPIFKILASNDTGNAPGHQAGIVIPKAVEDYFPRLAGTTPENPTAERRLNVTLNVPGKGSETVWSRYQHQTWGGTRSPERRLTDNLSFLRNEAHADDILLIERNLHDLDAFRLTLLKAGTAAHADVVAKIGNRRWGAVSTEAPPVQETEIIEAEEAQEAHETKPLELFDNTASTTEARVKRIARSAAFQQKVVTIYEKKCALCGKGLLHPMSGIEVEAAHIVPRALLGADDARNGLALCRTHHWAFDRGLFGIDKKRLVHVPDKVSSISENNELAELNLKKLRDPTDPKLQPSSEAFEWHLANVVEKRLG